MVRTNISQLKINIVTKIILSRKKNNRDTNLIKK